MRYSTKAAIISDSRLSRIAHIASLRDLDYRAIQIAESYSPTTASDWTALDAVSSAPSTQDSALDYIATSLKNLEANDPDTIITAQGDLIVGDASNEGAALAIGTAYQIPAVNSGGTTLEYVKVTNDHVDASAAIAYSKLNLSNSVLNADINSSAAIAYSKLSLSNSVLNADINSSAAIVYSKLSLSDSILNADINSSAAIAYSKLNLSGSILNADINASAAIAYSKLSLSNSILNADINSSAAIAYSKLDIAGSVLNSDLGEDITYSNLDIADSVSDYDLDRGQVEEDFTLDPIVQSSDDGTAPTGTTGDINIFQTPRNSFQWHVKGTQTATGLSWVEGSGIAIDQDQTDNDGIEITQGVTSSARVAKTVGTDNVKFTAKLSIATVAGTDNCYIGLRKAQAYDAAVATYTDYAGVNINAGDIIISTDVNNAGETATDSTDDLGDAETLEVDIYQGDEAYLQTALALANDVKAKMNNHFADATEHTAGQQTSVSTANATTTSTLITLVSDMMTAYIEHEADAVLASDWVYHIAQTGDDDSLASEVAPTSLSEAVTRINDLKAKLNLHMDDGTAHTDGDTTQVSVIDSCNTYIEYDINGAGMAAPTATAAFNFDSTDVIVPFIYFLHANASQAGDVYMKKWKIVDLTTATS